MWIFIRVAISVVVLGLIALGAFFLTYWWIFRSPVGGAVLVFFGCVIIWEDFIQGMLRKSGKGS